ncbi:hypothetical protein SBADM41S_08947 [Streptomyces badius]
MQIFGSCVVFPDPVSPATITTWWSRIASRISSFFWLTGSSSGYDRAGSRAARAASRSAAFPASAAISSSTDWRASGLRMRRAPSRRRPSRFASRSES